MRASGHQKNEAGAALIVALVFVVAVGLLLVGLLDFAGGSLLSTGAFKSTRATEYSADGATDIAIQAVRFRPNAFTGGTLQSCLGTPSVTIDNNQMEVYCTGTAYTVLVPGNLGQTRTINFYTCSTSVQTCNAASASVSAVVDYFDVSLAGSYACSQATSATCGSQVSIVQWTVNSANV